MEKIYIHTMGCYRRLLDAEKISSYLKINGFKIVKSPSVADYIILNTCAFKKSQEDFAISKVKEFTKLGKKLIIGGCLPAINKKRLKEIFNGIVFTPLSINKLDDIFNVNVKFKDLADANKAFNWSPLLDPSHRQDTLRLKFLELFFYRIKEFIIRGKRYFIRISWGCMGQCSYCGIKNAIGPLKSKSIQECLSEFKKGLALGYKNFTLVADDLGAYGLDIGTTFPHLLEDFLKIQGNYKIYLFEFSPQWIIKYVNEMIPIIKTEKITGIDFPVQSGSDKILKIMNRPYRAEEAKNAINKLKEANPKLRIAAYIIIGFPGETEEDFEKTIMFLKEIKSYYTWFYPYCDRPNAPAASLPDKVSWKIIKERIKKAKKRGL